MVCASSNHVSKGCYAQSNEASGESSSSGQYDRLTIRMSLYFILELVEVVRSDFVTCTVSSEARVCLSFLGLVPSDEEISITIPVCKWLFSGDSFVFGLIFCLLRIHHGIFRFVFRFLVFKFLVRFVFRFVFNIPSFVLKDILYWFICCDVLGIFEVAGILN